MASTSFYLTPFFLLGIVLCVYFLLVSLFCLFLYLTLNSIFSDSGSPAVVPIEDDTSKDAERYVYLFIELKNKATINNKINNVLLSWENISKGTAFFQI